MEIMTDEELAELVAEIRHDEVVQAAMFRATSEKIRRVLAEYARRGEDPPAALADVLILRPRDEPPCG